MIVTCTACGRVYDDASRWTICPHGPLGFAPEDYCPNCDVVKSAYGGECLCDASKRRSLEIAQLVSTPYCYTLDEATRLSDEQRSILLRTLRQPKELVVLEEAKVSSEMIAVLNEFRPSMGRTRSGRPRFYVGAMGSVLCDRPVYEGQLKMKDEHTRAYCGCKGITAYFVCDSCERSVAKALARGLGGELLDKPWWEEKEWDHDSALKVAVAYGARVVGPFELSYGGCRTLPAGHPDRTEFLDATSYLLGRCGYRVLF